MTILKYFRKKEIQHLPLEISDVVNEKQTSIYQMFEDASHDLELNDVNPLEDFVNYLKSYELPWYVTSHRRNENEESNKTPKI